MKCLIRLRPGAGESRRSLVASAAGVTVLELLAVFVITGILISIALGSYLGQTRVAKDVASKQYLGVAWRDAKAQSVTLIDQGLYPIDGAAVSPEARVLPLVTALQANQPELLTQSGSCADASPPNRRIVIDHNETSATRFVGYSMSDSGTVWMLTATNLSPPEIRRATVCLPDPPAVQSAPTVAGAAQQSQSLNAGPGSWDNEPDDYSYQWQRCDPSGEGCVGIAGAVESVYIPTTEDVGQTVRVQVTATNAGGSNSAVSVPTSVVLPAPPLNTTSPTITGTPQEGLPLDAAPGTWLNGPDDYSYQWQRCDSSGSNCLDVAGATDSSYTSTSDDIGHTVRVVVAASNAGGTSSAVSAPTSTIELPPPPVAFYSRSTSCSSSLTMSGSNNVISGSVHANGRLSLSGSSNSFGPTTYGGPNSCSVTVSGSNNSFGDAGAPIFVGSQLDWPVSYQTGDIPCTYSASSYTFSGSNLTLPSGTYCASGRITISGSNISGNVTFVAGSFTLSGSNWTLTPHQQNLLLFQTGSGSLSISGSNSSLSGTIYAPNATVTFSGSGGRTYQSSIVANRITLSGSGWTWSGPGVG